MITAIDLLDANASSISDLSALTGIDRLKLTNVPDLGALGDDVVVFVALLKCCSIHRVPVDWTMQGSAGDAAGSERLTSIGHLPPPSGWEPSDEKSVARWRRKYRYGLLHHRIGPQFIRIYDRRSGRLETSTMYGVDASLFEFVDRNVVALSDLEPRQLAMFMELVARGFALLGQDLGCLLSFRLKEWPVPCMAV